MRTSDRIRAAGLDGIVTPLPSLENDDFHARFASAGLIVFPSDVEGFGLPAVEAMRLGIPVVISSDDALVEVTGGNATDVAETDPASLADAVSVAWATPPEALERARTYADRYTADRMARETRAVLAEVAGGALGSG